MIYAMKHILCSTQLTLFIEIFQYCEKIINNTVFQVIPMKKTFDTCVSGTIPRCAVTEKLHVYLNYLRA